MDKIEKEKYIMQKVKNQRRMVPMPKISKENINDEYVIENK